MLKGHKFHTPPGELGSIKSWWYKNHQTTLISGEILKSHLSNVLRCGMNDLNRQVFFFAVDDYLILFPVSKNKLELYFVCFSGFSRRACSRQ